MKTIAIGLACGLMAFATLTQAHGGSHDGAVAPVALAAFDPTTAEQYDFGKAGDPRKVSRNVAIVMDDNMRFQPAEISVNDGDIVEFVVSNRGKIMHEMVIGTRKELMEHAAQMRRFPDMEHDEAYMVHVKPAKAEALVWHFNRVGEFEFACLIPGHFEAGMKGRITVRSVAMSAVR